LKNNIRIFRKKTPNPGKPSSDAYMKCAYMKKMVLSPFTILWMSTWTAIMVSSPYPKKAAPLLNRKADK
jgi:hypothetical protein